jgi:hypothetical protein
VLPYPESDALADSNQREHRSIIRYLFGATEQNPN